MNTKTGLRILLIAVAVAVSLPVIIYAARARAVAPLTAVDDQPVDPTLAKIADYKTWTLVNAVPVQMEPLAAISCARIIGRTEGSPHLHKYISVYVNQIGSDAMLHQRKPNYPVGTIIVKEKLSSPESKEPELLTVMLKREKGFNADSGDWEYLLLDGKATRIEQRGNISSCNSCHTAYKDADYVTRTYLSNDAKESLK